MPHTCTRVCTCEALLAAPAQLMKADIDHTVGNISTLRHDHVWAAQGLETCGCLSTCIYMYSHAPTGWLVDYAWSGGPVHTRIGSETQVASPVTGVDEDNERIDVRPAHSAPDDHTGVDDWALLWGGGRREGGGGGGGRREEGGGREEEGGGGREEEGGRGREEEGRGEYVHASTATCI